MAQTRRREMESAFNCLELALHRNTGDGETMAAVSAFRRKVNGQSLNDVCGTLYGKRKRVYDTEHDTTEWASKLALAEDEAAELRTKVRELQEQYQQAQTEAERIICQLEQELQQGNTEMAAKPIGRATGKGIDRMENTTIHRAQFGVLTWDHPNWNVLRKDIVLYLIEKGVPIGSRDEPGTINETIHTVHAGRHDGLTYIADADISLRNRNSSEILGEIHATAQRHGIPYNIEVVHKAMGPRQTGKAGGKHATGSVLPGAGHILKWTPEPQETV